MDRPATLDKTGQIDWLLLGATAALLALGLMIVYSSSTDLGYREFNDPAHFFRRQSLWAAIGLVALFVTSRIPYRHWKKLSIPIMGVTLIMLAVRKRLLFGQSVSPVELAKLAVVIYIGHWLSSKGDELRKLPYGLLPFTIMVGAIAGLVVAQPDLSEAVVIVLTAIAMFFLAGADVIQFAIGAAGGLVAFGFVIKKVPSAMDRLTPFLEAWRDPLQSTTDQLRWGLIGLGSGGLLGRGPGSSRLKYQWLPASHTDSIFAIAGEELGLLGSLLIIGLFVLFVYRGLRLSAEAPDSFGSLLVSGITCWIGFQALINLAVVTGIIPFSGSVLPFISVGGSSLVTTMTGVGIMLSVSRQVSARKERTGAWNRPPMVQAEQGNSS